MEDKKFIITFKGDKVELHKQLKLVSAYMEANMQDKVIQYIEEGLLREEYFKK
jgi:hypothetical protein